VFPCSRVLKYCIRVTDAHILSIVARIRLPRDSHEREYIPLHTGKGSRWAHQREERKAPLCESTRARARPKPSTLPQLQSNAESSSSPWVDMSALRAFIFRLRISCEADKDAPLSRPGRGPPKGAPWGPQRVGHGPLLRARPRNRVQRGLGRTRRLLGLCGAAAIESAALSLGWREGRLGSTGLSCTDLSQRRVGRPAAHMPRVRRAAAREALCRGRTGRWRGPAIFTGRGARVACHFCHPAVRPLSDLLEQLVGRRARLSRRLGGRLQLEAAPDPRQ
jgi:hypothetical protein